MSSSAEQDKPIDPSSSKDLPTFEDWCDEVIKKREDYVVVRTNVIYYGVSVNLTFSRIVLLQLSKKYSGMCAEETEEFKKAQQEWWYYYRKIMALRSFLLTYFDIPPPNWKEDIMPERKYCGILLSQEDFEKFLVKEGSGMRVLKEDSQEQYEADLKSAKNKSSLTKEFKEEEEKELEGDDELVEAD